jgi:hypothetical protein
VSRRRDAGVVRERVVADMVVVLLLGRFAHAGGSSCGFFRQSHSPPDLRDLVVSTGLTELRAE